MDKVQLGHIKYYIKKSFFFIYGFFLPVKKNKIVFSANDGIGYTGFPSFIANELAKRDDNFDMVWLSNDKPKELPPRFVGLNLVAEKRFSNGQRLNFG